MLFVTSVMHYGGDKPYFVHSVMHYGGEIPYFVRSVMQYGGDIPYFVRSVMHYGALRSITEVTTPLFSLRTGLIQILINLLKIL